MTNMKNPLHPLEEDDVFLLNQDTFTVRRFKELVRRAIDIKLGSLSKCPLF